MFGNCCGRSKNEEKNKKKSSPTNENVTHSDNNVINSDNVESNCSVNVNQILNVSEKIENEPENPSDQEEYSSSTKNTTPSIVVEQPKISRLKRQSTVSSSDPKTDLYENDDEVFCEGVGAPIKLADNLGTSYPYKQDHTRVPLPRWFSEEDQEVGGIQEPPATPVGRDELALRRHRFFSELLSAAQNATEHKVRFDPLGPIVAGVVDHECCQHSFNELDILVTRLETVTERLEHICTPFQEILNFDCNTPENCNTSTPVIEESPFIDNMSVPGFQNILQGPFATYLVVSQQIGGDVATHSALVERAFHAQLQYLVLASQSKAPNNQSEQMALLQPTSQHIGAIQDFREKHRTSPYFNHLSAISESIPALGWVTVSPAPAPYVKEMNDAGQFYTNRVLKDWKEKDKRHVDWVKAWVQTLSDLQAFVKQYHTTGLTWTGKNAPTAGMGAPPPPPGCPPPPLTLLGDIADLDSGHDRSALFAQINQGENITKNLKKVTADMQTHKNPTLRTGPAPFVPHQANNQFGYGGAPQPAADKPPVFARDGKKWLIEYQKGNHNLMVENAEMNNVVYLYKCVDSTVTVKGKINSITLDSCKKTSIVFDSVVSAIEFINCQSVQMQVFGKVPTISIDKTDGCQVYLSPESLDVEVISSKSSEMNMLVPKPNGDYVEYPVPEQYKTTVNRGGLKTLAIESKG